MRIPGRIGIRLVRILEKSFEVFFSHTTKMIQRVSVISLLWLYWRFRQYIEHLIFIHFDHRSPKHIYDWGIHNFFLHHIGKNMNVLDIGCGAGELTTKIAKKAKSVVGYDRDKKLITLAKERNYNNNVSNIEYFVGDALKDLPIYQKYDIAILSSILTFVSEPNMLLRNLHKVTNCLLIRETRFDDSYLALLSKEFGVKKSFYFEYTKGELLNLLTETGWEVVDFLDTYDVFLKVKSVRN